MEHHSFAPQMYAVYEDAAIILVFLRPIGGLMELIWTDDLSVGNAVIDLDHKNLLDIADNVVHAIEIEDCSAFSKAFEVLEFRLRSHVAHEEDISQIVKFPYARYRAADQHFLKELDLFKEELLSRKCQCCGDAIKHYSDALRRLLIDHIVEKGRLMKPFLHDFPYDLSAAES